MEVINILNKDPCHIYRLYPKLVENNIFNCFDNLKDYISIYPFYDYLISIEKHKCKNIWNHGVKQWNRMCDILEDKNKITLHKYMYQTRPISHGELNDMISSFCDKNIIYGIFFVNCILRYIFY